MLVKLMVLVVLVLVYIATVYGRQRDLTYVVYCPPHSDECIVTLNGVLTPMSRVEFPRHIPIASKANSYFCYLEFCYNADLDIIGLNPNYHLWRL